MGLHGSLLYSPPAHFLFSMVMALHQHGHGHSHVHDHKSEAGHAHGHAHDHDHKNGDGHAHGHAHNHDHKIGDGHTHGHAHGHGYKIGDGHTHGHSHNLSLPIPGFLRRKKMKNSTCDVESGADGRMSTWNINVQAAFIHVIGDLIQSIGVVIAAYIIRFKVRPDRSVYMRFVN